VSSGYKLSKLVTQTVILFLCLCVCVFVLNINTNLDTVSGVRFLVYPTLRRCLNVCSQAKICECVCLEHAESSTQQYCYVMQSYFGVVSGVPLVRFECTRGFRRNEKILNCRSLTGESTFVVKVRVIF